MNKQTKPVHVTYTCILHDGTRFRFAVLCQDEEQAHRAVERLKTRTNVRNIRLNRSGRHIPTSAVFFYHEFINR